MKDSIHGIDLFSVEEWKNHEHTHDPTDPVLGHDDPMAKGGTCDDCVEIWHKWLFQTPASINPSIIAPDEYQSDKSGRQDIFSVKGNNVMMVTVRPMTNMENNVNHIHVYPDTDYICLGVITAEAGREEYPSKTLEECSKMIIDETNAVESLGLVIDEVNRIGCDVDRTDPKNPLKIENVASENLMGIKPENMNSNNAIEILYNGFWALIAIKNKNNTKQGLDSGDHFIKMSAKGRTYFIDAMLAINVLI